MKLAGYPAAHAGLGEASSRNSLVQAPRGSMPEWEKIYGTLVQALSVNGALGGQPGPWVKNAPRHMPDRRSFIQVLGGQPGLAGPGFGRAAE